MATATLAGLEKEVEQTRDILRGLQRDVARAKSYLAATPLAELLAVNEQLLLSALHAQTQSESATLALEDVARSAELDHLTGLPNRHVLLDRLTQAIAIGKRHRTHVALLFLDLDNFKIINDTLGHAAGDQALQLTARCLTSSVRAADTVCRHGGDEFVILLSEVANASDAVVIGEKLIAKLGMPSHIADRQMSLQASIGISIYPDDGEDPHGLIASADKAMYMAKRQGQGRVVSRSR